MNDIVQLKIRNLLVANCFQFSHIFKCVKRIFAGCEIRRFFSRFRYQLLILLISYKQMIVTSRIIRTDFSI